MLAELGAHSVVADVTVPNSASIGSHARFGFNVVGMLHQVGHRLDRDRDGERARDPAQPHHAPIGLLRGGRMADEGHPVVLAMAVRQASGLEGRRVEKATVRGP